MHFEAQHFLDTNTTSYLQYFDHKSQNGWWEELLKILILNLIQNVRPMLPTFNGPYHNFQN